MPRGDGRGPFGLGPGTGRRRGCCKRFRLPYERFYSQRIGLLGDLIPIAVAVLRDSVNPKALFGSISKDLLNKKSSTQVNKEIKANYRIINETEPKGNIEEKRLNRYL